MNFRSTVTPFVVLIMLLFVTVNSRAQVRSNAQANSATHVAAEMTKGKLNPGQSKPGDQVAMRLKDDLKSNGEVLLKKGTTITGVVRNVKTLDGKSQNSADAQSMMQIEWLVPAMQGRVAQQLSIALQSVTQISPISNQEEGVGDDFGVIGTSAGAASARSGGGGLLGGAVSTVGAVGSTVTSDVAGAGSIASRGSSRVSGQSNAALLSMPSVVAADNQTAAALENTLGASTSGPLFKVGRGELVSANGSRQSVDIFSHLSNDTVITSRNKNFEISSGAQMQLLVGVNKQ